MSFYNISWKREQWGKIMLTGVAVFILFAPGVPFSLLSGPELHTKFENHWLRSSGMINICSCIILDSWGYVIQT